ncbi:Hypothetical predicted protein [Cloeon dipterum]|uniref:NADP-dependent oxidoreductase domain-containing protein n=1 Tax=Cloeon dipterum TaxID=197152 RepID=A0A8S1D0T4_9INSE|nr:Hypothetical predicted protein [Cloeon dipterum]
MKFVDLPGGVGKMPIVGYGTWQAVDSELEAALEEALTIGYRHIDTAYVYENEHVVGKVLKKWLDAGKVKRDELFVVTKLPEVGNRPDGVEKYIKRSLENLQLDYIDLYLVHVPFSYIERGDEIHPRKEDGSMLIDPKTDHVAVWKAMEAQVAAGRTKAIGLSNFNERQIERVVANATIKPVNLQVEVHAYFQQKELEKLCKKHGITMVAYSPLGSKSIQSILAQIGIQKELPDLFDNQVVLGIAEKLGKTPAQVLLRHTTQRGIAVIPKSVNPQRMKENFEILNFELTEEDVKALDELDQGPAARVLDFSFFKGIQEHPEFPF